MHRSFYFLAALALMLTPMLSAQGPTARNGYTVSEASTLLADFPTGMTVDAAGALYCITYNGQVFRLTGPYSNTPVTPTLFFDGSAVFTAPCTGITFHNNKFYVSHQGTITTLEDTNNDQVGDLTTDIITGLPWLNDHQNNQIVFDENNKMYFGLGSQNDHTPEVNPMSATIMSADANGANLAVHATGVRNAFGLAYKQGFGLFAADNGPNALLSNPLAPDEINRIVAGSDYGYPDYYGFPPAGTGTEDPAFLLPAHAAPTGMTFDLNHQFSGLENDLYCTLFAGGAGALVRVSLSESPLTGDIDGSLHLMASGFANVIDCVFVPSGELIVADFTAKKLYSVRPLDTSRVHFTGEPRIGNTMQIEIVDPQEAGDAYLPALSTNDAPAFPVAGTLWHMDINSFAFQYTTTVGNGILNFPGGFLDAQGRKNGNLYIPNDPSLVGLNVWFGFLSAAVPGLIVGSVSETLPFTILGS